VMTHQIAISHGPACPPPECRPRRNLRRSGRQVAYGSPLADVRPPGNPSCCPEWIVVLRHRAGRSGFHPGRYRAVQPGGLHRCRLPIYRGLPRDEPATAQNMTFEHIPLTNCGHRTRPPAWTTPTGRPPGRRSRASCARAQWGAPRPRPRRPRRLVLAVHQPLPGPEGHGVPGTGRPLVPRPVTRLRISRTIGTGGASRNAGSVPVFRAPPPKKTPLAFGPGYDLLGWGGSKDICRRRPKLVADT